MHRFYTSCLALATATAVSGTPTPPLLDRAAASCTDASLKGFQWTVEDFDYHASYIFSTPAHQNSWGYVDFNLSNPAVPDVLESCSAASSQLEDFFYGTVVYQCALNATSTSAKTPPTFSFNRITGELDVNQTWTCYDKDPKYPSRFSAYGKLNLTLGCTDNTWQNPDWQSGEIYSDREVKCAPETVSIKPYKITAVA